MKDSLYKFIVQESSNACAYYRILFNEEGRPYDYEFLEVNPSFEKLTGLKSAGIIGKTAREIFPHMESDEVKMINEYGKIALYGGTREFERYSSILKNYYKMKVFSPEKYFFVTIFSVISELDYRHYDNLTGLYNRIHYEKEKKRLNCSDMLPLSVIIGDINGLKLINDVFGHEKGDILIRESARILKSCSRKSDVLSRIGDDEFCILMPQTDSFTANEIVKQIKKSCEEYNQISADDACLIDISLGFSTKEKNEDELEKVVKIADDYMYKHKLLERNSSHSAIISSIRATMNERSQETELHAERLAVLSRKLGIEFNISEVELNDLELFATLHDIGKVCVDDRILNKPGKLTDDEWCEMKKHPEIGYRIAKSSPNLVQIADYILAHHERWDGTGYPQGQKGEDIPFPSRILAVVDAYDAMTQDRPYRKMMDKNDALAEIKRNSGTQFDPSIAEIFVKMI